MADTRPERRFTRIDRLPPYVFNITAELKMAARRRGEDIIDFSMGNPDGATPPHIVEKLCTVAQRPDTHGYSTSRGIPRLRRAISRWYQDRYDVEIDPESEAIVTIGSKEGLAHLMLATLDHGDTVLVPNPSYPIHIYGAVIAGAQVRSVPLVEGVDFFNELERAILESYPKPKMMILGFPSNPTAQCVELEFFEKVVALAKRYDVLVVHDGLCRYRLRWLESAVNHAGTGCTRCGSRVLYAVEKLQHGGLAYRLYGRQQNAGQCHGANQKLSRLRHFYAVAGGGDCGAGGRSTVRARHCRTVQTPPRCIG